MMELFWAPLRRVGESAGHVPFSLFSALCILCDTLTQLCSALYAMRNTILGSGIANETSELFRSRHPINAKSLGMLQSMDPA
jgi:predicted NAD-dependent protein-ADP-ribosyltransferase YbiA (DUF1768 family)